MDKRPTCEELEQRVKELEEQVRDYWRHQRLDGTPIETEVNLCSIKIRGEPVILETFRDITRLKQTYEKFQKFGMECTS